ncbi:hypothetical protein BFR34_02710 [Brochothrix thermosphacta DSM 20171 = FSL F6-1036]|uniref:hypothetical protein n=1 Tax=Brochothrix thermosphacta TaxID=2756 RepID=UPI0003E8B2FC|nr:hypothetical protein BTHER_07802 [Brochothrix thermosphacta DSM 20171 = FSL F6-1036]ODJ50768.1 hypothetical protein BFR34_02710 [Brochothrix thermosphacta DSM 20171 = FSL F6-1036]
MKFLKVLAIRTGNNKGSDSSFKTKKNWKKPLDDIFTVIGWFLKFLKVLVLELEIIKVLIALSKLNKIEKSNIMKLLQSLYCLLNFRTHTKLKNPYYSDCFHQDNTSFLN